MNQARDPVFGYDWLILLELSTLYRVRVSETLMVQKQEYYVTQVFHKVREALCDKLSWKPQCIVLP